MNPKKNYFALKRKSSGIFTKNRSIWQRCPSQTYYYMQVHMNHNNKAFQLFEEHYSPVFLTHPNGPYFSFFPWDRTLKQIEIINFCVMRLTYFLQRWAYWWSHGNAVDSLRSMTLCHANLNSEQNHEGVNDIRLFATYLTWCNKYNYYRVC